MTKRRSLYVFYHYFPPDDVVSAILFGDLASGLAEQGWRVTAFPCVWEYRDETRRFASREEWRGVLVRRIWRPRLVQASSLGRILNAMWMAFRWSLLSLKRESPDVLLVGTDPILSILVARAWKLLKPRTQIVHWCFDLYPEASIADGLLRESSFQTSILRALLNPAYRACSLIVDLGPCMRRLLVKYHSPARHATIVPWALEEPAAPLPLASSERNRVFGDTRLALLYSGSFGRAHSWEEILDLAEGVPANQIRLAFSTRGNREAELRAVVADRRIDVRFVPFAAPDRLLDRLACADVHVISLRRKWTGTVVPSKFFGALAAGRPVLFAGDPDSSIASWIRKHDLGWVLTQDNIADVRQDLLEYSASASQQKQMQKNCFTVYREFFSKDIQLRHWNEILNALLDALPAAVQREIPN